MAEKATKTQDEMDDEAFISANDKLKKKQSEAKQTTPSTEPVKIKYLEPNTASINGLKSLLATNYMKQIENFFSDKDKALHFLSAVTADVQRNPKLLKCTPESLVNAYIMMAQLQFMPSGISGEAYVLPYKNNTKLPNGQWLTVMEAQFQLGYQGLVTLFYRAGVEKITSGIVRKNDKTSYVNGEMRHEIDLSMSRKDRGEAIGAYVTVRYMGNDVVKFMNGKDILAHGKQFSKSFGGSNSPWLETNDPELWMWIKTVLKQAAKLLPKNETINRAIAADNEDSYIAERKRIESAKDGSKLLSMGNLLIHESKNEEGADEPYRDDAPSIEIGDQSGG